MTTFSQMVDSLVAESLRPEQKANIPGWINQTIRELHTDDNGMAVGLSGNLVEELLTAVGDEGYVFDLPKPHRFQKIESVWYDGAQIYARERTPSSAYLGAEEINGSKYFYRTGNGIAFNDYGGNGAGIRLAYYQYPRKLTYYAAPLRPCAWSDQFEAFAYLPTYDNTEDERLNAQDLCTNWILQRYEELVLQGSRQKLYARLADDTRSKTSYSMYKGARPGFFSAETHVSSTLPIR